MLQRQPVFLVGFMGSGKSTLGTHLARLLHRSFIDLDTYIETREQSTITQLFGRYGENGFREREQEALAHILEMEEVVIATGGGTPCFFDNMDKMNRAGITIYLQLSPEALRERLLPGQSHRPLIAGKNPTELLSFITQKLSERDPFYRKAKIVAAAETLSEEAYVQILKESGPL